MIDPPGYVNIIPMLPDTDPADQTHIKEWLRDGDVLVYIHPEDTSPKDQMERRSSHVAMHYEYTKQDGTEIVHHIDNPNSYGPRYNHPANRHMPFHVYRFQPKETRASTARRRASRRPSRASTSPPHSGMACSRSSIRRWRPRPRWSFSTSR